MKRLLMVTAAVAVLALAAVAVGGAATSAQEGDGPLGSFLAKLADRLGVGEDELRDAISDTQLEMIDEAVADGKLTDEQADRMRDRIEEGGILFPPRSPEEGRHRPRPGVCQKGVLLVQEAAAQVLDMPVGQIVEELKDGNSLAEIAEAQGMSVEAFTESLLTQIQVQIDELVAEDKLTEEQAEHTFARFEENIDRIVNATPGSDGPCSPGDGQHPSICQRGVGLVVEATTQVLDMPREELLEELKDGKSPAEVAEAQGMSVEAFTESLLTQIQLQLDELVADDKLTEEQAERIFQGTSENIDRIVNAQPNPNGPCPPRHGPRPFGGPGLEQRGFGEPFSIEPADEPFGAEPTDVTA